MTATQTGGAAEVPRCLVCGAPFAACTHHVPVTQGETEMTGQTYPEHVYGTDELGRHVLLHAKGDLVSDPDEQRRLEAAAAATEAHMASDQIPDDPAFRKGLEDRKADLERAAAAAGEKAQRSRENKALPAAETKNGDGEEKPEGKKASGRSR